MNEFEDVNTADIRYVFGAPILFAAVTVLPQLAFMSRGRTPSISLIVISIVPVISFIFVFAFGKMTTVIADDSIRLTWRFGFPTKEIPLSKIQTIDVKEISNWLGSGIKGTRTGMMWRAWGKKVVVVEQFDGKTTFVGSDNPEELASAIRSALKN
ncbi:MAG: hypothetical protein CL431_10395 [Acidimicrobiaceae bacterium]|jgi:hypothetical protein|nr:hypothetical protein [Acidimicrobiaceae bacterium]|tara:strand:+ start:21977 stop:22441 length:465 start_codon:yes stop_codon:yes gene_type:complete